METPNNEAGRLTELVMAALTAADVLKPDDHDHPTHYNRAFSNVYESLQRGMSPQSRLSGMNPVHAAAASATQQRLQKATQGIINP